MKAKDKIIIKSTTLKEKSAQHRKTLIETGAYGRFKEKSIPSKKVYDRKKNKAKLEGLIKHSKPLY